MGSDNFIDIDSQPGLAWTKRHKGGIYTFHEGQLGIAFCNVPRNLWWQIPKESYLGSIDDIPSYVEIHQEGYVPCVWRDDVHRFVYANQFFPVYAPDNQLVIMDKLLRIASITERLIEAESTEQDDSSCNYLRDGLNELYSDFVTNYGSIRNYQSYWDNDLWYDMRLETYIINLVDGHGKLADIFTRRTKFPPSDPVGQQFFQDSIPDRVESALSWCMAWLGKVDVPQIAEKAGVDEAIALELLLENELVYRVPEAVEPEWWEVLGVDKDINSDYQLTTKWKQQREDDETFILAIDEAYKKALPIVTSRLPYPDWEEVEEEVVLHHAGTTYTYQNVLCKAAHGFSIGTVPKGFKEKSKTETPVFLIWDDYIIGFFTNETKAVRCLIELSRYPKNIHSIDMQSIIKFYGLSAHWR
jgi:hypothetical protein